MLTSVILPLLLIFLSVMAYLSFHNRLYRALNRNLYQYLAVLFVLCYVVGTVILYLAEYQTNHYFEDLPDSFWSVTIYVLSGFEDRPPISLLGRIISVFIFLLALCLMGSIAGRFASAFIHKETIKMPSDIKRQIVLCNWNMRGDRIIRELHSPQAVPETEIVVISESKFNEEELRKNQAYDKVYFIRSDPVLHDVLKSARAHLAQSIIILVDEDSPDPDAKSALVALALKSICRDLESDNMPHIVAEAKNHRKTQHLYNAGIAEIICATDLGLGVLAQCALHAKLSTVYNELLTYGDETNEIYIVSPGEYSTSLLGKTFLEASQILTRKRDAMNPAVLIGLRRGDQILVNPRRVTDGPDQTLITLEENDSLIVISYEPPDLLKIE